MNTQYPATLLRWTGVGKLFLIVECSYGFTKWIYYSVLKNLISYHQYCSHIGSAGSNLGVKVWSHKVWSVVADDSGSSWIIIKHVFAHYSLYELKSSNTNLKGYNQNCFLTNRYIGTVYGVIQQKHMHKFLTVPLLLNVIWFVYARNCLLLK